MYWNDGSYYRGYWAKGLQDGEGVMITPDGRRKEGMFSGNKLIESRPVALPNILDESVNGAETHLTTTIDAVHDAYIDSEIKVEQRSQQRTDVKPHQISA